MDVFVARQPILDRKQQLHAYELLYRTDGVHNEFDGTEAASATTKVISSSILSIGLERILCGKKAFLNFDHRLLLDQMYLSLPRHTIVIEILESTEPTSDLIALCKSIHEQGYLIALDDFVWHPRMEPLTQIAKLIKIDTRATARVEQERLLRAYQPRGIAMLAEKVETQEEFDWAFRAGYDFFQGYFFARPVVVRGQEIPAVKTTCLRLLRETQRRDIDFERLASLIREDISLSYKLLRYANSALFGRRQTINSMVRALMVLGEDGIRRWIALAMLPLLATDKPGELITLSIVRAHFCERLAQLTGTARPDDAFLMGLFSVLDALIDRPLEEALNEVNLDPCITNALLSTAPEHDVLTTICRLNQSNEVGNWEEVKRLSRDCGIPFEAVGRAYSEATLETQQLVREAGC
jgi:c-di-GMP-related signal transduction protein